MIACTSPAFTMSERPVRIGFPPISAWRLSIVSIVIFPGPRIVLVRVGFLVGPRGLLLVGHAQPHSGCDPGEHRVHVFENVGGLGPHPANADRVTALVGPSWQRVGRASLLDDNRPSPR